MKNNKALNKIIEELVANGIGWVAGLLSIDLLDLFFIQKSWKNVWGVFSKRTVVDANTYSFLEWALTAVIGLVVMLLVNKLVRNKLMTKLFNKNTEKINPIVEQVINDDDTPIKN